MSPTGFYVAPDTWARLLAKVHEIDPMVCPKCARIRPEKHAKHDE